MFFEHESNTIPIRFLGCWHFNQGKTHQHMQKRKFSTLSLRIRSNAVVTWDDNRIDIRGGMITFVPQNIEYSRECDIDEFIAVNYETYNYVSNKIITVTPYNYDDFYRLFQDMMSCYNAKAPGYMYKCTSILCEILSLLQAKYALYNSNTSPLIAEACEYMRNNYTDSECTVKRLADISHMSEAYFRQLFKQVYDISPKKYINTLRVEHAARLLSQTVLPISEISERSGFSDSKYFATVFKSIYNTTPSDFRSEDELFCRIKIFKE